jgi:hypothetical protein
MFLILYIVYCTSICSTIVIYNRVCRLSCQKFCQWSFAICPVHHNVSNLGMYIHFWFVERLQDIALYGYTVWQVCEPCFTILCFCYSAGSFVFKRQSWAKSNWLVYNIQILDEVEQNIVIYQWRADHDILRY